jgi:nitroreductase
MDTFDAVRTMMAVRRYQNKPVPEAVVRKVLEAGRLTGSSINLQPWAFIAVQDRAVLEKLGQAVRSGSYTGSAAFAVVVAVEKASQYAVSDGSRAIQSMLLTAWSEGVGGNWTGWLGMRGVRELLGIPAGYDVLAVLAFGYPALAVKGKKKRKAIGEVAHRDRWGRPWE